MAELDYVIGMLEMGQKVDNIKSKAIRSVLRLQVQDFFIGWNRYNPKDVISTLIVPALII